MINATASIILKTVLNDTAVHPRRITCELMSRVR